MITDFHELDEPIYDKHSDFAGAEWYVCIKGTESYYLMVANNKQLGDLMTLPDKEFYFPSEADAHAAAYMYYTRYGQAYPYMKEWSAVRGKDAAATVADSQVMEFI